MAWSATRKLLLAASSDPNDAYYLCRDDERCWDRLTPEQQQAVIAREARPQP